MNREDKLLLYLNVLNARRQCVYYMGCNCSGDYFITIENS